jgi:ferrochelatase
MGKQAVLLVAHGTPETVEQVPAYLLNVTGGRPLPPAVVEEIQRRYARIGPSPLTSITCAQARLVEAELAAAGEPVPVYVAMRNWQPYIADVIRQMRADGVEEIAAIPMAPHNSRTSVGLYRRAVEAETAGLRVDFTVGWADHPLLIEAFAGRLRPAWEKLSAEIGEPVPVLFTAHSVPVRTIEAGDSYAEEARRTAQLVATRVAEIPRWWFAFQSQGASGGEWLGPSVEATFDQMAAEGIKALIVQPIGFLCDHVEILYDVDIQFREAASKKKLRIERPESLNASHPLVMAVTSLARAGLRRLCRGAR